MFPWSAFCCFWLFGLKSTPCPTSPPPPHCKWFQLRSLPHWEAFGSVLIVTITGGCSLAFNAQAREHNVPEVLHNKELSPKYHLCTPWRTLDSSTSACPLKFSSGYLSKKLSLTPSPVLLRLPHFGHA